MSAIPTDACVVRDREADAVVVVAGGGLGEHACGQVSRGRHELGARLLSVDGDAVELELPALHVLPADEADVAGLVRGFESCGESGHASSNARAALRFVHAGQGRLENSP